MSGQAELPPPAVGDRLRVTLERVGTGGVCIAHHAGQVVFVRHGIPGEQVDVAVREVSKRFLRADVVTVVTPSPDRVEPPCPYTRAERGLHRCGGCDWQHVGLARQREYKAAVVAEQLQRLAGIDWPVVVEPVGRDGEATAEAGLGWRTRMQFAVTDAGELGLREDGSHALVALTDQAGCRIAHPALAPLWQRPVWGGFAEVEAAVTADGGVAAVLTPRPGIAAPTIPDILADSTVGIRAPTYKKQPARTRRGKPPPTRRAPITAAPGSPDWVELEACGRRWRVANGGFWQVHPHAAQALTDAVRGFLADCDLTGATAADLYSGVGLFTWLLAELVGLTGTVYSVEGDAAAVAQARHNLRDYPQVQVAQGWVTPATVPAHAEVVLLDPPRAGAGEQVARAIAASRPRRVVYVACDPACFARDLATFATQGYHLTALRAFDLFPMTHHVECVASLVHP